MRQNESMPQNEMTPYPRRRHARSVLRGTVGLLALLTLAPAPQLAATADTCYRIDLPPMGWARGGAWDAGGRLLVLDLLEQRFVSVDPNAGAGERVALVTEGDWNHPFSVKQENGTIWLLDHGRVSQHSSGPRGEMLRLDNALRVSSRLEVENRRLHAVADSFGDDLAIQTVYDWARVSEGFVGFADLRLTEKDAWMSAFLYFDGVGNQRIYRSFVTTDPVCNQYVRNSSYVAALNDTGYLLFLDERPSIGRVHPNRDGVEVLPGFPADFRSRPSLVTPAKLAGKVEAPRQATYFYEVLEESRLAAGLYAWNDHLYLLGKEPINEASETTWWLIELRPSDGSEVARFRLPTTAAHLDVIPGQQYVALVEKGRVQGIGDRHAPYMTTSSVLLIPTAWFESAKGRLGPRTECEAMVR